MIETLIVAALVLWSTIVVFKKVFPRTSSSVFLTLANFCADRNWQMLAKWLKPKMVAGCGGHCACPATEDQTSKKTDAKKPDVQAVKWK